MAVCWLWVPVVFATDSDLRITDMQRAGSVVRLSIEHPQQFTNRFDVLSSVDLRSGHWMLQAVGLSLSETNALVWTEDTNDNFSARFYRLGNHDLDSDEDGLPDASEQWVYHTDPVLADGDEDGVPDGVEIERDTNPSDPGSRSVVVYVDSEIGSDALDGFAKQSDGTHGPKGSLGAAERMVYDGDVIEVSGLAVFCEPGLCLGRRNVVLRPVAGIKVRP